VKLGDKSLEVLCSLPRKHAAVAALDVSHNRRDNEGAEQSLDGVVVAWVTSQGMICTWTNQSGMIMLLDSSKTTDPLCRGVALSGSWLLVWGLLEVSVFRRSDILLKPFLLSHRHRIRNGAAGVVVSCFVRGDRLIIATRLGWCFEFGLSR
jgi:hypothetical protein